MIALSLLRNRYVVASLGLFALVGSLYGVGAWRYRVGYGVGVAARAAQAKDDAAAAQMAADSAWRVQFIAASLERDRARAAEQAAARARTRAALADARLTQALSVVRADTTIPPACEELATACSLAQAAWTQERDTLAALIATQDTALMTLRSTVADEHTRTRAAVQTALVSQRATFRAPSRSNWAAIGAVVATIITLGAAR